MKGLINKSGSSSSIFLVSMSTSTHSSTRLHQQQQHIKVFLIYHIFNKKTQYESSSCIYLYKSFCHF
jgi:hypothetical protein